MSFNDRRQALYVAIFFAFLTAQGWNSFGMHLLRDIPIEPDDYYHYLMKGFLINECLRTSCRALADIRDLALFATDETRQEIEILIHRLTVSYHPLYSVLVAGMLQAGAPLERIPLIFGIVGFVASSVLLHFFLVGFLPLSARIIVLGMLVFVRLEPSWGMHYVNPFTAAGILGLAALLALNRDRVLRAFACLVAGALMHKIGIVICAMVLFWYVLHRSGWRWPWRRIMFFGCFSALIVATYPLSFHYSDVPPIDPASLYHAAGFSSAIEGNLGILKRNLRVWGGFGLLFFLAPGFIYLWRTRHETQSRAILALAASATTFTLLGLFHPAPESAIVQRIWILPGLALCAICALGIIFTVQCAAARGPRMRHVSVLIAATVVVATGMAGLLEQTRSWTRHVTDYGDFVLSDVPFSVAGAAARGDAPIVYRNHIIAYRAMASELVHERFVWAPLFEVSSDYRAFVGDLDRRVEMAFAPNVVGRERHSQTGVRIGAILDIDAPAPAVIAADREGCDAILVHPGRSVPDAFCRGARIVSLRLEHEDPGTVWTKSHVSLETSGRTMRLPAQAAIIDPSYLPHRPGRALYEGFVRVLASDAK